MPASASAIRAGRAFVELFAEDSSLVRTLKANEKRLKDFGNNIRNVGLGLAGVGAAIITPLAIAVLWSGLPTRPPELTEGLTRNQETFGRRRWHGQETVPKRAGAASYWAAGKPANPTTKPATCERSANNAPRSSRFYPQSPQPLTKSLKYLRDSSLVNSAVIED